MLSQQKMKTGNYNGDAVLRRIRGNKVNTDTFHCAKDQIIHTTTRHQHVFLCFFHLSLRNVMNPSLVHFRIVETTNLDTQLKYRKKKGSLPSHTKACLAHGILLGPAPRGSFIFVPVCLIHVSNLWHQRIIRIWVRQQRTDRKQHLKMKRVNSFTH